MKSITGYTIKKMRLFLEELQQDSQSLKTINYLHLKIHHFSKCGVFVTALLLSKVFF